MRKTKTRNPNDLTLRNLRAVKAQIATLRRQVKRLELAVLALDQRTHG